MPPPLRPKIYHIVHVDRLASIAGDGCLWSDAMLVAKQTAGTTIGMSGIKWRRLHKLELSSHPGLNVGQCVPFYFCPSLNLAVHPIRKLWLTLVTFRR
jgi:hypothetical protein